MSKKKLITTIVCISLAVIIAVFGCLYFFTDIFKPSLNSVLEIEDKTITKMTVIKYDQQFEITDPNGIKEFLALFNDVVVTKEEEIINTFGAGPCPIVTLYAGNEEVVQFDVFGTMVRRYDEKVQTMDNRKNYKRTALYINTTIESSVRDGILKKYIPDLPLYPNKENEEIKEDSNVLVGENN